MNSFRSYWQPVCNFAAGDRRQQPCGKCVGCRHKAIVAEWLKERSTANPTGGSK